MTIGLCSEEVLCSALITKLERAHERGYSIRVSKQDIKLLIELLEERRTKLAIEARGS